MALAYSFHISNKGHAITTIKKVAAASKHNLRKYKSKEYDRENIRVLRGNKTNILNDVEAIYHQEFDDAVEKYNSKQKRNDRKIADYLHTVSENSKTDVAAEVILQIGDMEFWKDKSVEEKEQMIPIYEKQLEEMEKLIPAFKIANATVHLDESSPHMHIIGVPVSTGYKRGMNKQVSKTSVFTKDSLTMLQEKMRVSAEKEIQSLPFLLKQQFKPKQKGRNSDWSKEYYALQDEIKKARIERAKLMKEKETLCQANNSLLEEQKALKEQNTALQKEIGTFKNIKEFLQKFISKYKPADQRRLKPADPDYYIKLAMQNTYKNSELQKYAFPDKKRVKKENSLYEQAENLLDGIKSFDHKMDKER